MTNRIGGFAMQLRQLLDHPDLGLELLVDPGAARELEIARVFVTDQPLPERYLSGGELLLTGMLFHSGEPGDSDSFVASAIAGGAIAIGAGIDHLEGIPEHFVEACRTHRLPLFSVPADVSFAQIIDEFIARTADRAQRLRAALDQSRRLLSSLAAGRELDDLASTVVGTTGIGCKILTATGRRVCALGRPLTEEEVDEILRAAHDSRHFPLAVGRRTVIPVGRVRDAARAWYLVVDTPPSTLSVEAMDGFSEFASIAALLHARDTESDALLDRHDDLAISEMLSDPTSPGSGVILVVRCREPERVRPLVRDVLAGVAGRATVAVSDGDVVAHVATRSPQGLAETLRLQLRRVLDLLDGPLSIGYCEVTEESGLGGAVRGARQASRFGDEDLSVTSAAELGTAAALFSHLPDQVRIDFVRQVLGPLEDYDAATDAGLLETLVQFMDNGCSWVRTADAMHMHQNTVRYRIARTEQLTGRNLADMGDRVDIRLALDLR
ncbi:MAG: helix-turn-helix domain-containing protein [Gordonia sp. (in: high G+C Gram-positive bacteria)]|uniref:helix-turn-helix domain-containing protein n=1 Tax=Gordonia sp. (in: high G+C Gram-positive bacteria) TaxID=84139 RepID=UPI0039E55406